MFKHLLVPLDGSPAAETALPAAVRIARANAGHVTLLHLIERNAPATVHGERHLRQSGDAAAYLEAIAVRWFKPHIAVTCHVHREETSQVAQGIAAHLAELQPDAVVMTRHGRRGFRDALFGSMTEQVVSLGTLPVLLVRPPADAAADSFTCRRILIPHDGDAAHEPAVTIGVALAKLCRCEVRIVGVVPTRNTLAGPQLVAAGQLPRLASAVLEIESQEAVHHLSAHLADMKAAGLPATAQVMRGDPVRGILRACRAFGADIVVIATHGRTGTEAFWAGSVGSRICARAEASLLLVPVGKPQMPRRD